MSLSTTSSMVRSVVSIQIASSVRRSGESPRLLSMRSRTAIRSRGITLYLEPKFLYNSPLARANAPSEFAVPFGKARRRREGTDLTIAAYGTPVHFALEAAQALGCRFVGVVHAGTSGFRQPPAHCLSDLGELPELVERLGAERA